MTLYHRKPSQYPRDEDGGFPVNNAAEMGSDPAVQRAHDAGNVPADPPEEPTLRGEIAAAVEMLAKACATVTDIYRSRTDVWDGLIVIRRQHDALHEQLQFIEQLAEGAEERT